MSTDESSGSAAPPANAAVPGPFAFLSDDIVLNILARLESDPRHWARLACVSSRLAALVRDVCCRSRCSRSLPDLVSAADQAGGWATLHKLSVCCPGLLRAGVLLEHSDFGLDLDIGPDHPNIQPSPKPQPQPQPSTSTSTSTTVTTSTSSSSSDALNPDPSWSLFDDLYFDTVYDASESHLPATPPTIAADQPPMSKKRKKHWVGPVESHLASGAWSLSREQGNKLLASRFRGDCLYICDWPGCVHAEEKRNYMLFRGVFKNFKRSRVWRTINDNKRDKIGVDCAFCACKETWDLHSAFCLRRVFGFHDDGEPVVRAYVCENGHVSGAWTERPMLPFSDPALLLVLYCGDTN